MADVREKVDQIRQAIYGIEVRESIASGIEAINTEVESTTQRQTALETDMAEAKREAEEATTRANTAAGYAEDITEAMAVWEEYDPEKDYAPLNKVAYQGSSYINVLACKGVPPTEETHWLPIASKGDKGEPGPVPTIIVGDTTTLSPGSAASVTRRADSPDDAPVLDFGIPRGVDGTGTGDMSKVIYDDNDDGKVNAADIADAVPTGAITDDMLSNDPNHIKARLSSHMADNVLHANFIYEGKRYTINNPYAKGGSLSLKGQLHSHTNNSDGVNQPSALVTAYKNAGYDFVSITDHDYLTPNPNVAGIVFINGIEDTFNRHIIAYDIATQSTDTNVQTVINYYRALAKLCSIAHPNWANTKIEKPEMKNYYDYNFIEVYNATTHTYGENQWDWALSSGKKVFGLAVDDCHNITGSDFNKGWVVVKVDANDKESILQSLRDGNFYASTGNDIAITVEGQDITALSSELSNFTFIGFNGRVLKTVNGVTSASYTIKGDELYVRVKSVKVSDSTIAWSQPVFIDCLGNDGRLNVGGIEGYEEGLWTPIIAGQTVFGSHTYSKQEGKYTRIGNLVTLEFDVQLSNKDAAMSGIHVNIRGMPFVSTKDKTVVAPLWYSGIDLGEGYTTCQFVYGTQNVFATLYKMHRTTPAFVTPDDITNTTRFIGTITYRLE